MISAGSVSVHRANQINARRALDNPNTSVQECSSESFVDILFRTMPLCFGNTKALDMSFLDNLRKSETDVSCYMLYQLAT